MGSESPLPTPAIIQRIGSVTLTARWRTPMDDSVAKAIEAGERAHILTIGSPQRLAFRVVMGRCSRRGTYRKWVPDVFIIKSGRRV